MYKFNILSGGSLKCGPVISICFNDIADTISESIDCVPFYFSRSNDIIDLEYVSTPFPPEYTLRDAELPWLLLSKASASFKSSISLPAQSHSKHFGFKIIFLDGDNEIFLNDEIPVRYFSHYSRDEFTGGLILHLDPNRSGVIWAHNNEWLHRENIR